MSISRDVTYILNTIGPYTVEVETVVPRLSIRLVAEKAENRKKHLQLDRGKRLRCYLDSCSCRSR